MRGENFIWVGGEGCVEGCRGTEVGRRRRSVSGYCLLGVVRTECWWRNRGSEGCRVCEVKDLGFWGSEGFRVLEK